MDKSGCKPFECDGFLVSCVKRKPIGIVDINERSKRACEEALARETPVLWGFYRLRSVSAQASLCPAGKLVKK